jgi:hypothetical protein
VGSEITEEKLAAIKDTIQWAMKMAPPKNKELLKPDKE